VCLLIVYVDPYSLVTNCVTERGALSPAPHICHIFHLFFGSRYSVLFVGNVNGLSQIRE
jgi:hypothetical protein